MALWRRVARGAAAWRAPSKGVHGRALSSSRWNDTGRWEAPDDTANPQGMNEVHSYLLQESFGEYFQVPNPSGLMTKIICTIGPSTCSQQKLGEMLDAGMSAVRLNASHGEYAFFEEAIKNVRAAAAARRRICPVILDTKGPEVRIGTIEGGPVELQSSDPFTFYKPPADGAPLPPGDASGVFITYDRLAETVEQGDVILVDDGRLSFLVREVLPTGDVLCAVIMGGPIVSNKGVNVPGCPIDLPHLTDKDRKDIEFAAQHKVEYIAHSFTRAAAGIMAVREVPGIVENGTHVIAKIESQEGLDNIRTILKVSDGIMVARGDLGVEIPLERVSSVQKRLIRECNVAGKFVITATEMLDSMMHNPRPTRAEASDVANAVFDGTDCVMLSGETAVGKYPIATIQVMSRICKEAELDGDQNKRMVSLEAEEDARRRSPKYKMALGEAFSMAAVSSASEIGASLIIAITRTGETARTLAKYCPDVPVLALTTSPKSAGQVSLYRGVIPYLVQSLDRATCVPLGIAKAMELSLVSHGSRVVLVTGHDDTVANRLESFVVGAQIPSLGKIPGQKYAPGSSFQAP